uniref:helix-turn-helix domain-containing protein n=2 Tax=Catenibacterium mitsuokai TaxID=100886 RepID=UPI003D78494A
PQCDPHRFKGAVSKTPKYLERRSDPPTKIKDPVFLMGRKSKFSKEQKIEICQRYLDGSESISSLAEEINVSKTTIERWIRIFKAYGDSVFDEKPANESYTKEFKRKVVEAYLAGEGSLRDIAVKYKIPACGTVLEWVKLYNDHIELKDYIPGGKEIYMAKCRKVTKEERIEIAKYCMEHNLDYSGTCKVFDVTYSNVFNWVRKYKEKGEEGLSDRRGRRKKDEELDELGLLKKQLREKERELERAHLEIRLLKKVEEIERRGYAEQANSRMNISQSRKSRKKTKR